MTDDPKKIDLLLEKLDLLMKKQQNFQDEINRLRFEIHQLKQQEKFVQQTTDKPETFEKPAKEEIIKSVRVDIQKEEKYQPPQKKETVYSKSTSKSNLEKFIGENLINKIGIAITVIGVGIGAKYAIDHQMLSPLTRIILGYLSGLILLAFAIKLKKNYKNYSAVLLSGAMAILYFITYIAYSFYDLFPQTFAFALMVIFTIFTVVAALHYNQQVIAHIGLVGAYGVPFLLSDGSGRVAILFSYMAIINIGILFISFRKYWKPLYYSAFGLTWLIFLSWFAAKYETDQHFSLSLIFLIIFFLTFYLTFLIYKLTRKEKFGKDDIILLLTNSFIFFGTGYAILAGHHTGEELLGLFTLSNAIIHFAVALIIHKNRLADRDLFYLVAGLVLVFLTIAIPVQLDGNWVTLLWAGEAALLFTIGRTKKVKAYDILSYPLMILAMFSIIHDWIMYYGHYYPGTDMPKITPFINISFLSSVIFVVAFLLINIVGIRHKNYSVLPENTFFGSVIRLIAPSVLLATTYFMFRVEIVNYFKQLYLDSAVNITHNADPSNPFTYTEYNTDLNYFRTIWMINFSIAYLIILSLLNIRFLKNGLLAQINLVLNIICIAVFLTQGLYFISELRESYLQQKLAEYYNRGIFHITIRYITMALAGILVYVSYIHTRQQFVQVPVKRLFDLMMHLIILWVASSELIHWLDMAGTDVSYKLGLSILWGIYALILISLGIWKQKKYLRIGAISLFGVTLLKLFFYDISHLSTIAKTIVFVSLGVLLLIISFLYNKYKHIITDETDEQN